MPKTSINDVEQLKVEKLLLKSRIEKKESYFHELEEQIIGLQNLVKRNEHRYSSGNTPSGGVSLPFILVQTHPRATVEVGEAAHSHNTLLRHSHAIAPLASMH